MSTQAERAEIKALIRWYEARGADWTSAVEFLCAKANGCLPRSERQVSAGYFEVIGQQNRGRRKKL